MGYVNVGISENIYELLKMICIREGCIEYLLQTVISPYDMPPVLKGARRFIAVHKDLLGIYCHGYFYSECLHAIIYTAYRRGIRQPAPKYLAVKAMLPEEVWQKIDAARGRTLFAAYIERLIDAVGRIKSVKLTGSTRSVLLRGQYLWKLREKCDSDKLVKWHRPCLTGLLYETYLSLS